MRPARETLTLHFAKKHLREPADAAPNAVKTWAGRATLALLVAGIGWAFVKMVALLLHLTSPELHSIFVGAGATFLRVELTLALAALWTVPVGIFVGLRPQLSAIAQPIAQVAASVPATALFPIILLVLIRAGGGLGIGSIVLLLLGTQWYLLFNVIAGAISIPSDLKEVVSIFRFGSWYRWRELFLPAIFPYLITGFVTASGGAWNASIVAEYFHLKDQTLQTLGLGAQISAASDHGQFSILLLATIIMSLMVVTVNRLVWRPMYRLAETKFRLDT